MDRSIILIIVLNLTIVNTKAQNVNTQNIGINEYLNWFRTTIGMRLQINARKLLHLTQPMVKCGIGTAKAFTLTMNRVRR